MTPTLSIVIPWCNRAELGWTIQHNAEAFRTLEAEVLIVNCGGDAQELERLVSTTVLPRLRLIDIPQTAFNKCLALNIGASLAEGRHLFFLDADILITPAVLGGIVERAHEHAFVTIQWVIDSAAVKREAGLAELIQMLELVWSDGERLSFEFTRSRGTDHARGGPGLVCMLKEHFVAVEGMNSALTSWGWEDLDLVVRLQAVHRVARMQWGEVTHLAHDDKSRNLAGTNRHVSARRNMSICYANYGRRNFLGTLSHDIAATRDRVVEHGCRERV